MTSGDALPVFSPQARRFRLADTKREPGGPQIFWSGRKSAGRRTGQTYIRSSRRLPVARDAVVGPRGATLARATIGIVLASWVFLGAVAAAQTQTDEVLIHGPLAIRNQSPIQLLFFQFVPERAVPLGYREARLRLDIAETNSLTADTGNDGLQAVLDLEMTYANLQARMGLGANWEAGIDLPIIAMHGGFMDGFIDWFEELILYERGIRNQEDGNNTTNEFTYRISRDGETVLQGDRDRVGLGDLALQVKWVPPPFRETASTPAVALRLALKVPTGDEDAAMGSGRPDIGVGLALEKTLKRWTLYGNMNATFPIGDRFSDSRLTVHPIYSGLLGAEYRITPRLGFVGQMGANSAPFRHTGLRVFDHWSDWAAFGLSWAATSALLLQIGIMENLITTADAGADFGFFLSASYRFSL